MNNVLFYSEREVKDQHFKFNNSVINGIAFWTLGSVGDEIGSGGGEINFQNSQGCLQIIADKIALENVRFNRCAFQGPPNGNGQLSEPGSLALFGMALIGLVGVGILRSTNARSNRSTQAAVVLS